MDDTQVSEEQYVEKHGYVKYETMLQRRAEARLRAIEAEWDKEKEKK